MGEVAKIFENMRKSLDKYHERWNQSVFSAYNRRHDDVTYMRASFLTVGELEHARRME